MVEQRFSETRKPGTILALVGGGSVFPKEGRVSGNHSFHYWDEERFPFRDTSEPKAQP
jgi:hypothetical protein